MNIQNRFLVDLFEQYFKHQSFIPFRFTAGRSMPHYSSSFHPYSLVQISHGNVKRYTLVSFFVGSLRFVWIILVYLQHTSQAASLNADGVFSSFLQFFSTDPCLIVNVASKEQINRTVLQTSMNVLLFLRTTVDMQETQSDDWPTVEQPPRAYAQLKLEDVWWSDE